MIVASVYLAKMITGLRLSLADLNKFQKLSMVGPNVAAVAKRIGASLTIAFVTRKT